MVNLKLNQPPNQTSPPKHHQHTLTEHLSPPVILYCWHPLGFHPEAGNTKSLPGSLHWRDLSHVWQHQGLTRIITSPLFIT